MKRVEVIKPAPAPPTEYHVTMTEDEAKVVCALLGRCSGAGTYELFDQLDDALEGKPRSFEELFEPVTHAGLPYPPTFRAKQKP